MAERKENKDEEEDTDTEEEVAGMVDDDILDLSDIDMSDAEFADNLGYEINGIVDWGFWLHGF